MKTILLVGALILSITMFGAAAVEDHAKMPDCPMKVQGAELSVTDLPDAVALTMTTKEGDVAELRRRAENMAKMHSEPSMMNGGMMLPFTANYEEVPNGARLKLKPKDPAHLEEFRAQVRQYAERMKNGECSMMSGMMNHMMHGMVPKTEKPPDADHSAHHE
jgi:hypothetical protein